MKPSLAFSSILSRRARSLAATPRNARAAGSRGECALRSRASRRRRCRASSRRAPRASSAFASAAGSSGALVDAGAFVHKGDALAYLDQTDFQLQLEQAEAELASANSVLTQAEAEEKRITSLTRQGWSASADFDKARSAADQARAGALKAQRAVSLARNSLGYATLVADADGVVSAAEAEPGQVVAAGAPVVRLAHVDVKEAAVAVPENLVDRVRAAAGARRILGAARRDHARQTCASSRPTPTPPRAPTPRASACPRRRRRRGSA